MREGYLFVVMRLIYFLWRYTAEVATASRMGTTAARRFDLWPGLQRAHRAEAKEGPKRKRPRANASVTRLMVMDWSSPRSISEGQLNFACLWFGFFLSLRWLSRKRSRAALLRNIGEGRTHASGAADTRCWPRCDPPWGVNAASSAVNPREPI